MAGNYPSLNDSNFDLLKKITSNTAEIADEADIPPQPGNSGKLLTTNGTNTAWTTNGTLTSLTSPAATPLTLGLGTGGTALTLATSTLAATFAGTLTTAGDITAGDNTHLGRLNVNDSTGGLGEVLIYGNVLKLSARTAGGSLGFRVNGDNSTVLDIASTGVVSISNATAGSAGAGALVIEGGLAAAGASYFGGAVTIVSGTSQGGLAIKNTQALLPALDIRISDVANVDLQILNRGSTGYVSVLNGVYENFRIYNTSALVAFQGAATFAGDLSAQRLEAVDAAANNRAAAFIRTQNNTTYSSSVLSIQGDRTTSNSSYNLIAAANGDSTGQLAVRDSGNVVNTNNSYGAISDQKLKENIVDATAKLQKLNQVRIVNFNRIGNGQKQIGVIAQELEQIFPSMIEVAIDRDAEGNDLGTTTKSVKYSVFVPMLIKAVQELTARLAALEAK